jgi:hypothetical protein
MTAQVGRFGNDTDGFVTLGAPVFAVVSGGAVSVGVGGADYEQPLLILGEAITAPSSLGFAGGIIYVENSELKYLGQLGTVTTIVGNRLKVVTPAADGIIFSDSRETAKVIERRVSDDVLLDEEVFGTPVISVSVSDGLLIGDDDSTDVDFGEGRHAETDGLLLTDTVGADHIRAGPVDMSAADTILLGDEITREFTLPQPDENILLGEVDSQVVGGQIINSVSAIDTILMDEADTELVTEGGTPFEEVSSTAADVAVSSVNWDRTIAVPSGDNRLIIDIVAFEGSPVGSSIIDPGGADEVTATQNTPVPTGSGVLAQAWHLLEAGLPSADNYTLRFANEASEVGGRQIIVFRGARQAINYSQGVKTAAADTFLTLTATRNGGGNFPVGSIVIAVVHDSSSGGDRVVSGDAVEIRDDIIIGSNRFAYAEGTLSTAKSSVSVTFTTEFISHIMSGVIVVVEPAA